MRTRSCSREDAGTVGAGVGAEGETTDDDDDDDVVLLRATAARGTRFTRARALPSRDSLLQQPLSRCVARGARRKCCRAPRHRAFVHRRETGKTEERRRATLCRRRRRRRDDYAITGASGSGFCWRFLLLLYLSSYFFFLLITLCFSVTLTILFIILCLFSRFLFIFLYFPILPGLKFFFSGSRVSCSIFTVRCLLNIYSSRYVHYGSTIFDADSGVLEHGLRMLSYLSFLRRESLSRGLSGRLALPA